MSENNTGIAPRLPGKALRGVAPALVRMLGSCASLPDYHVLHRAPATQAPVAVISARGQLSPRESASVLTRLQSEGGSDLLKHHLEFIEPLNDAPLTLGNATRLLIDGPAAHSAMFKAIAAARTHVNLQTYILESDAVGRKLAELLMHKRAQGVQVNVLYDSVGSINTPAEFFETLRQADIGVCEFNPITPLKGKTLSLNNRDHRKILIVDGTVAFTGGINISAVYSSSSWSRRHKPATEDGWRDTQIEISGPAVAEFQKLFMASWEKQKCPAVSPAPYFPELREGGDRIVRVIGSSPADPVNPIYVELLSAIIHARHSIHVTMAYFVPDPQMITALQDAARRGVDVRLILPGVSDFWVVLQAGRSHYTDLLAAGVQIYERKDALLHAKTAVIDGVWSTVGSTNMDWRSFLHNDEVNAVVLGEGFGSEMTRMFRADLAAATRIDPAAWAKRGITARLQEWSARLVEYWL